MDSKHLVESARYDFPLPDVPQVHTALAHTSSVEIVTLQRCASCV